MTTQLQTKSNDVWFWVGVAVLVGIFIAAVMYYTP
jgi:hypothetical protein